MAGPTNRGFSTGEHQRTQHTGPATAQQAGTRPGQPTRPAESLKETAQEWASTATTKAGEAWDATREGARQVAERAEEAWEGATDFVSRHPIPSLLFAFCVGLFVAGAFQLMGPMDLRSRSRF